MKTKSQNFSFSDPIIPLFSNLSNPSKLTLRVCIRDGLKRTSLLRRGIKLYSNGSNRISEEFFSKGIVTKGIIIEEILSEGLVTEKWSCHVFKQSKGFFSVKKEIMILMGKSTFMSCFHANNEILKRRSSERDGVHGARFFKGLVVSNLVFRGEVFSNFRIFEVFRNLRWVLRVSLRGGIYRALRGLRILRVKDFKKYLSIQCTLKVSRFFILKLLSIQKKRNEGNKRDKARGKIRGKERMILSKEFKIKIRTFNCTECERFHSEAYYNCTKTYSDCRHYRKNSWRAIDKQVNEVRKQVFEELIKNV